MIFEERLDVILATLNKEKKISNRYLTQRLGISESTLRRDLDFLEDEGKIKRVHGGAVLTINQDELSFSDNELTNLEAKKAIAKKASKLIKDKMLIFIDGGSTTNILIDYIEARDIKVVTNGITHLGKLMERKIPTNILGGEIKIKTGVSLGPIAMEELSNYKFDLAFLGANGFDGDFYYTADLNEALLKRRAKQMSDVCYVLADSSKENLLYHSKICRREDCELIREDK